MSIHKSRWQSQQWRAELAATSQESREDDLFDAIVSAAALTARVDGHVQDVERAQFLDFLERQDLLWMFDREEALAQFERRVRELREPDEALSTFHRLRRYRDSRAADLILGVCDEVAAADCRLDPREHRLLRLVRNGLDSGSMTL